MIQSREAVIKTIESHLNKNKFIDLCILYGSAAQDRLNDRSDIDIALGCESGISYGECLEFSRVLTLEMDREVSVIDIEKMEGLILQEVLCKGITLKNDNPVYKARFLTRMWEFNEDLLPFQMMTIEKKLKDYLNE